MTRFDRNENSDMQHSRRLRFQYTVHTNSKFTWIANRKSSKMRKANQLNLRTMSLSHPIQTQFEIKNVEDSIEHRVRLFHHFFTAIAQRAPAGRLSGFHRHFELRLRQLVIFTATTTAIAIATVSKTTTTTASTDIVATSTTKRLLLPRRESHRDIHDEYQLLLLQLLVLLLLVLPMLFLPSPLRRTATTSKTYVDDSQPVTVVF